MLLLSFINPNKNFQVLSKDNPSKSPISSYNEQILYSFSYNNKPPNLYISGQNS